MTCPKCGANMVKGDGGTMKLCYPPIYIYEWICGCGYRCEGVPEQGRTEQDRWQDANPGAHVYGQ